MPAERDERAGRWQAVFSNQPCDGSATFSLACCDNSARCESLARTCSRCFHLSSIAILSLDPKTRRLADILSQGLQTICRITLTKIYGKHPTSITPTRRCMRGVMIKQNEIAGIGFNRRKVQIPISYESIIFLFSCGLYGKHHKIL